MTGRGGLYLRKTKQRFGKDRRHPNLILSYLPKGRKKMNMKIQIDSHTLERAKGKGPNEV